MLCKTIYKGYIHFPKKRDRRKTSHYAIATIPASEIQLVNGSGLGEDNRLSPRVVILMLITSDRLLQEHGYKIGDLFPEYQDIYGKILYIHPEKGSYTETFCMISS